MPSPENSGKSDSSVHDLLANHETSEVVFQQLVEQRTGLPIGDEILRRFMENSGTLVGGIPGSGKTAVVTGLAQSYPFSRLLFFDRQLRDAEKPENMGPRDLWTAEMWRNFTSRYVGNRIDSLSQNMLPEEKLIVEVPILGITDRGVSPARDIAKKDEGPRNRNNTLVLLVIADPRVHERAREMRIRIQDVDDRRVLSFLERQYNTLITGASDYKPAEAGKKIKAILSRTSPPREVGNVDEERVREITDIFLSRGSVPEGKDRMSEEEETRLQAIRFREQLVGLLESTPIPPQARALSPEDQEKIRFQFSVADNLRIDWGMPQENWIAVYNVFRQEAMHYLDLGLRAS